MENFIDLTWIETIEQLNAFKSIQEEYGTGLNKGKIKISKQLEKVLKSQMNIFDGNIKKVYDWEIYEDDSDWCLKNFVWKPGKYLPYERISKFNVKKMLDLIRKDFQGVNNFTKFDDYLWEIIKKRSGLYE